GKWSGSSKIGGISTGRGRACRTRRGGSGAGPGMLGFSSDVTFADKAGLIFGASNAVAAADFKTATGAGGASFRAGAFRLAGADLGPLFVTRALTAATTFAAAFFNLDFGFSTGDGAVVFFFVPDFIE